MAKYEFDFSDFSIADLLESQQLNLRARGLKEALAENLFGIKGKIPPGQDIAYLIDYFLFVSKFLDGHTLADISITEVVPLSEDFVKALAEKLAES